MCYKASLIFRTNVLLRTVAKFVERDAHTMGDSFGVSVGACVARARSMFRHCVFRLRFFVLVFGAAAQLSVHVFDLMGLEQV